jgi:hypothetical protein
MSEDGEGITTVEFIDRNILDEANIQAIGEEIATVIDRAVAAQAGDQLLERGSPVVGGARAADHHQQQGARPGGRSSGCATSIRRSTRSSRSPS